MFHPALCVWLYTMALLVTGTKVRSARTYMNDIARREQELDTGAGCHQTLSAGAACA
jgi:hypothetical protein